MADYAHGHDHPYYSDGDTGSHAAAWIVGIVALLLILLAAWWLFASPSSPFVNTEQKAPTVNVTPPAPQGDGDTNIQVPGGGTTTTAP